QFYDKMGITRDVASRPDESAYGLRGFLSCKYLFDYRKDGDAGSEESFIDEDGNTKMPYWSYVRTCNGFDIYENDCYVPMGFVYDSFVTEEEFEWVETTHRTEAILYSMVLTRDQMEKYSDITGYDKATYDVLYSENPEYFDSVTDKYKYGKDKYKAQCEELAESSCSDFKYTKDGFTATYNNTGDDNLLFFSVPYSEGFTATVNGEAVDVEKVNYGFMAVKVPANTKCDIVFTYETPGFSQGVMISLCALGAFVIYLSIVIIYRRKKKSRMNTEEI
ncbi:MAG: YfhO family protein, partial [Ruminococcus sp.]|nr:YfhO family protein [Ruminococcus sp.]